MPRVHAPTNISPFLGLIYCSKSKFIFPWCIKHEGLYNTPKVSSSMVENLHNFSSSFSSVFGLTWVFTGWGDIEWLLSPFEFQYLYLYSGDNDNTYPRGLFLCDSVEEMCSQWWAATSVQLGSNYIILDERLWNWTNNWKKLIYVGETTWLGAWMEGRT